MSSRTATIVFLGTLLSILAIVIAWFAGDPLISTALNQLDHWESTPRQWLQAPSWPTPYLWLLAIGIVTGLALLARLAPPSNQWLRALILSVLIGLTLRYVLWRSCTTLNLSNPLNGVFSLILLSLELLSIANILIQLVCQFQVSDRREEAAEFAEALMAREYLPSVDILIPTYNESPFILRRTILGCQAQNYGTPHGVTNGTASGTTTIYLLDDTQRPAMQALAAELGCQYITRPLNAHAKAGNLNHALPLTEGELIAVLDADFVPTENFLTATVGFFQDPQIGLVQTPQCYYNPDPIALNLGLTPYCSHEEEVFFRQIQPVRAGNNAAICVGTSFIVRRSALLAVGGFVTDSLTEDYFTGVKLAALGYQLVYLNQKLSAGLAAENARDHISQRLRWAQGNLQAFFIDSNPLTIPGLTLRQRFAHLGGLLHWLAGAGRLGFLLMPLVYLVLGAIPLRTTLPELVFFFIPYYFAHFALHHWLSIRSRTAILSDVYSTLLCVP
ncbi:MAG: glycosyltransferase family 2 protein [Cyanobacteria bacterium P01_H01_bin.121]